MPIKADCSSCSHSFNVPSKYAGKKVKCPKCKEPLVIPAAGKKAGQAAAKKSTSGSSEAKSSAKIAVKCKCGKKFGAKPEWAGKKVKCPGCSEPVRIPGGALKKSSKSKSSTAKASDAPTIDGLFDEVGFNTEDGSAHRKCPECRSPMSDEAIICIDCGYNENTGKKMETYRPVTAEERAKKADVLAEPEHIPKGGGGKRRKSKKQLPAEVSTVNSILYFLGIAPLLIYLGLWAFVNFADMPDTLDPQLVTLMKTGVTSALISTAVFTTLPCLAGAYLLSNGNPIGRIIAMIIGGLSLLGFPIGTLIGFFLLKNAMSDAAKEHCAS